jgi:hypothetical protein
VQGLQERLNGGSLNAFPLGLKEYTSSGMEVYKRETRLRVNRFLHYHLTFPGCISALDAALARLIPRLQPENLPALRTLMLANNEKVMKEMERRALVGEDSKIAPAQ